MIKRGIVLVLFAVLFAFSGCSFTGAAESESPSSKADTTEGESQVSIKSASEMFTDRDKEIGYDEETSAHITLSGDGAFSDSDAVQISGSRVTVTDEGTYIFSGVLEDGMIVVNAEDTDQVQLVLDNVQITSADSAAIYVMEADQVFLTTASGSENTLANGGAYVAMDDNHIDAAIFSKSDLTLNGAGTLTVTAAAGHGIVSKDDLALTSGTYEITAASHGLSGKDSVRIASGTYSITSGKDGIHAENGDDASKGFLYVAGGDFKITSQGDGMSASSDQQISDGTFAITTGEGSASVDMKTEAREFGPRGNFQADAATVEEEDSVSQKGMKADGAVTITGGSFTADTADDSIHAGGDILITGGEYELKSGDDAIHSDAAVAIQNGTFAIPYCYEGIEGLSVTVDDGIFDITSQDDGFNAAGGTDGSGFGGGGPQPEQFSGNSDNFITIHGGEFRIVSSGDCIDSNGALTINGGILQLTCNGNGNTALDCDGTYTNNGGDVTTNDGSENNPGQMGGGMEPPGGRDKGMGNPGGMNEQEGKEPPGGMDGQGGMEPPDGMDGQGGMEFPGGMDDQSGIEI